MRGSLALMPTTQLSVNELRRVAEQADRLQHAIGQHRLVDVEFEMALAAGDRDGGLIAEHAGADHGQRLALRRIGLARHDRGAELVRRQDQFAEPERGPEPSRRISLAILNSAVAAALSAPCTNT